MSTAKNESSPRQLKTISVCHAVTGEQMIFVHGEHQRYGATGRDTIEQLRPVGFIETLKACRVAELTFRIDRTERIRETILKFPRPNMEEALANLDRTTKRTRRMRDRLLRDFGPGRKKPALNKPAFVKENCEAWLWYAELAESRPEGSLRALKNTEPASKYLN